MRDFQWLYAHAMEHKGSADAVEAQLPHCRSAVELQAIPDDRYLSDLCRRVFRAGLKHSLVDAKWPAFEEVFYGFEPQRVVALSDEYLEGLMRDKRLIRHWGKLKTVRHNAQMVLEFAQSHGSFGALLAQWPVDDIVGLWRLLQQRGSHLGGNSAPAFLRMVGKDTFLLADDVVAALKAQGLVTKRPTGKRDLKLVQEAFNTWQVQSGRPLCHISRLLSMAVG